ncbi:hypothetical protein SCA6_010638 [Theobroma cacao]
MSYAMPSSFQLPHHSSKIPLWPSPNLKHGKPIFCSTNTTSFPTKTSKEKTFEETCNKTKTTSPPSLPQSIFSHVSTMSKNLFLNTLNIIDPPLHPSIDPNLVFTGNFAPVSELDPTDCQVIEGELPLSLNGVYIRNGPNPQLQPRRALHLFDGDGMLHSLRLSNGNATYCSRYVKTYKYMLEQDAGFPIIPNFFSGFYGLVDVIRFLMDIGKVLTGHIDLMKGFGVANTSIAFFSNKLLALTDSDLPYLINVTQTGDIETLGRWEFTKKLLANMSAHPKVDIETKETFAFTTSLTFPHLSFFRFDSNGVKQKEVPISSVRKPTFLHDLAITKTFAIFCETQLGLAPAKVVMGRGALVDYKRDKVTRIGIIPRYSTDDSDMEWFQVPNFNAIHIFNAWESGEDEIVLVASNVISIENIYDRTCDIKLEKVKINMRTGQVSRNILSPRNLEFGSINPCYVGKKSRFAYMGVFEEIPKMLGVVKIDLETGCEVGKRFYGPGCFGGEPLFMTKDRENNFDSDDEEDEGYVMSYVHNEETGESKFLVMDAKSPELNIVAAVKLPRRVPYGFHGLFFSKQDLLHF